MGRLCNHEISNGNTDDPEYAYCGLPFAHAGEHGDYQMPYDASLTSDARDYEPAYVTYDS